MVDEVKKAKKLSKGMEGSVVVISESVSGKTLRFDVSSLPEAIKTNLTYHGALQKLGDAAAGKEGEEAIASIEKVWDGLVKGDWTVRVPAAEKVTKKGLFDKVDAMPEGKEKEAYKKLLEKIFTAAA